MMIDSLLSKLINTLCLFSVGAVVCLFSSGSLLKEIVKPARLLAPAQPVCPVCFCFSCTRINKALKKQIARGSECSWISSWTWMGFISSWGNVSWYCGEKENGISTPEKTSSGQINLKSNKRIPILENLPHQDHLLSEMLVNSGFENLGQIKKSASRNFTKQKNLILEGWPNQEIWFWKIGQVKKTALLIFSKPGLIEKSDFWKLARSRNLILENLLKWEFWFRKFGKIKKSDLLICWNWLPSAFQ